MTARLEAAVQARFLMQSILVGVVQQLERIERLVEGVDRQGALRRHNEGDINHRTEDDNFEALKVKLMALSEANREYKHRFDGSCLQHICEWIERRPRGVTSPKLAHALMNTLEACEGNYQPRVTPLRLDERTLQELSSKLAYASAKWHQCEDEYSENPEDYVAKQQLQVKLGQKARTDVTAIREGLEQESRGSRNEIPDRRRPGKAKGDSMDIDEERNRESEEEQETTGTAKQICFEIDEISAVLPRVKLVHSEHPITRDWLAEFSKVKYELQLMDPSQLKAKSSQLLIGRLLARCAYLKQQANSCFNRSMFPTVRSRS